MLEGSISLKETLQQLVKEHVDSPPPLRIYNEIPEKLTDSRREAVWPELPFELLLREQGLTAIRKQREWLILPDCQVWREPPFRCQNYLLTWQIGENFPYVRISNPYR